MLIFFKPNISGLVYFNGSIIIIVIGNRQTLNRVQNLDEAACISLSVDTIGKGINKANCSTSSYE